MVNQIIKIVCIHLHRDFQVKYTVVILIFINKFTQACQWANAPLQAMVQPMAKRPHLKHDLHKQKPSMLEAQTFLSSLLTTQVKFTNPNLYIEPEGVQLHSTTEAFKTLLKSKPVIIMPEGKS